MIESPLERRAPLPPQLTRRVGVLGVIACVLFGVVGFRLWYLQVLTGPQNAALATRNVTRVLPTAAPRGEIVDRRGRVLATTRVAAAVEIVRTGLPGNRAARRSELLRLDHIVGVPLASIERLIASKIIPVYQPVLIKTDISIYALTYLAERHREFPGVTEVQVLVRSYPFGGDGAQMLGTVGPISKAELTGGRYPGAVAGDTVGQGGLEAQYDRYLRGRDGAQKVQVNPAGYPTGIVTQVSPVQGDALVTSLDLGVERVGMRALAAGERLARANHYSPTGGAFVAFDPVSGEVYGMGSLPTFDPNWFAAGLTDAQNKLLNTSVSGAAGPEFDRAADGTYPTGSTFKPITALAGLESGAITANTLQGAGSCLTFSNQPFCNSAGVNYGALNLENALRVSEDTYFYQVGANTNGSPWPIQHVARRLGLGAPSGIDLPAEASGVVPDPAWVTRTNRQIIARQCKGRVAAAFALACQQGYYFSPWTVGQNIQLATGQGYLLATPLQMAVAYAALANGGTVVTPHIGLKVASPQGTLLQQLPTPTSRHVNISPYDRQLILNGLNMAAQSPGGTSNDVFGNFPRPVYGKTGTAQFNTTHGQVDDSWYVAYAPDPTRPIVVAVTVEGGGFGDQAAAPAARLILSQWFYGHPGALVKGTSTTR